MLFERVLDRICIKEIKISTQVKKQSVYVWGMFRAVSSQACLKPLRIWFFLQQYRHKKKKKCYMHQKSEQKDEIPLLVALYFLVTVKAIFIFLLPASYGPIVNQKSKLSGSLCEGLYCQASTVATVTNQKFASLRELFNADV